MTLGLVLVIVLDANLSPKPLIFNKIVQISMHLIEKTKYIKQNRILNDTCPLNFLEFPRQKLEYSVIKPSVLSYTLEKLKSIQLEFEAVLHKAFPLKMNIRLIQ